MRNEVAFIYDERLTSHELSATHPLKPVRLKQTYELLQSYRCFDSPNSNLVEPRPVTTDELLTFHTEGYIDAVRRFSAGSRIDDSQAFNLGTGDNPIYPQMYEAALLSTGASALAADIIISGKADRVFSISGGLHHAMPGYAHGFCVFNDPVIAINKLLVKGMRVAYIDVDCHHGDGVQHAYYETDRVLTVSIHEAGQFLFPGTGNVPEIGSGKGRGYSVNLPLYPYTSDSVYEWAFVETIPRLIESFSPDILVTQLGVDSHANDPLTHLRTTIQGFARVVEICDSWRIPKWIALGGGGYDLHAVARAWTSAYGIMIGEDLSDKIPQTYGKKYGVQNLFDMDIDFEEKLPQLPIRSYAEESVSSLKNLIYPKHGIHS